MYAKDVPEGTIFYHGTKATYGSAICSKLALAATSSSAAWKHIYFAATLEAATWGAELAKGEGRGRIYTVEPTGPFEDDPNLTDQKFPGNVTASYRSLDPLRVTGEVKDWVGHPPERLEHMKTSIARMNEEGTATIIE